MGKSFTLFLCVPSHSSTGGSLIFVPPAPFFFPAVKHLHSLTHYLCLCLHLAISAISSLLLNITDLVCPTLPEQLKTAALELPL